MRVYPVISVTNNSTVISDEDVQHIVAAMQHQISYHFKPYWDSGANLKWAGKKPIDGTWEIAFLDDSDQAGALGYHDFDPSHYPVAKVFAGTDLQYGYNPGVTASHEALEMLADPYINLAAQTSNTEFYGYEVGDPVEADTDGYTINVARRGAPAIDVLVTNFILPRWFVPESPTDGTYKFDYRGILTQPLEVRDGGYVSIFTSGEGWGQYQNKGRELVKVEGDATDNVRFRDRSKVVKG